MYIVQTMELALDIINKEFERHAVDHRPIFASDESTDEQMTVSFVLGNATQTKVMFGVTLLFDHIHGCVWRVVATAVPIFAIETSDKYSVTFQAEGKNLSSLVTKCTLGVKSNFG